MMLPSINFLLAPGIWVRSRVLSWLQCRVTNYVVPTRAHLEAQSRALKSPNVYRQWLISYIHFFEKQTSLIFASSVKVFLDCLLGGLNPCIRMQRIWLGPLMCLE